MNLTQQTATATTHDRPTSPDTFTCAAYPFVRHIDGASP